MDGNSCKLWAVLNVHGADVCTWVSQSETDLSGSTLSLSHNAVASLGTGLKIKHCVRVSARQLRGGKQKKKATGCSALSCTTRILFIYLKVAIEKKLFWEVKLVKKRKQLQHDLNLNTFPNHRWLCCFNFHHQAWKLEATCKESHPALAPRPASSLLILKTGVAARSRILDAAPQKRRLCLMAVCPNTLCAQRGLNIVLSASKVVKTEGMFICKTHSYGTG